MIKLADVMLAKDKKMAGIQTEIIKAFYEDDPDNIILRPSNWELTVEELDAMKPCEIFDFGFGNIEHPWFNNANNVNTDGRSTVVKWVAARGGIHDWCIYHSMDANLVGEEGFMYFNGTHHLEADLRKIYQHGAKLVNKETIKKLVPCTEEAFNLYRF